MLSFEEKQKEINKLKLKLLNLTNSPLYSYRVSKGYKPVLGEGNLEAKVMFVGEAPGESEAKEGRPFCGKAGKVLDELLESIGFKREEVYITNVVKDRPPDNRDPFEDEIELYSPFLDKEIEIISPQILVALGRFSAKYLMQKLNLEKFLDSISKIRGKVFLGKGFGGKEFYFLPTFHPALALYSLSQRKFLEEDFKILKKVLEGSFDRNKIISYFKEEKKGQLNII